MSFSASKNNLTDVIIVGVGAAGLYAALQFPPDINVLMLSKYNENVGGSNLAQGGIAAVLDAEDDSFDLHIKDTLVAGGFLNNKDAVSVLVHEGASAVRDIIDMGVDFDRKPDGSLDKTLEGGHSRRRIMHHKDATGKEIAEKLLKNVKTRKNITILENAALYSLDPLENGFKANILYDKGVLTVYGSYCILCTGGIGRVYKYTTNPKTATGDGVLIAGSLGAKIKDLSYVQFHPTAFNTGEDERFLISESIRGEGAYLLNHSGERFMSRYDERQELAPRDVVSRSIILESRRTGSDDFFLDITKKDPDFVKNRFPGIYEGCLKYNIDITRDLIPIFPCQHYLMGGIETDLNGRTTVPRLYAAGECANTGVHGRNRLASNSLLEALVFGKRAALDVINNIKNEDSLIKPPDVPPENINLSGDPVPKGVKSEIRSIMQESYFVLPDFEACKKGISRIDDILKLLNEGSYEISTDFLETKSLATVAHIILNEVVARV